ncbi:MAG TPA: hypothetical protein VGL09_20930 [Methylomirabilota bacterium]
MSLALLGAYHGLNPAMGWLFAVSLGLQERSRIALLQALPAIALGHAASIALTVAVVGGLELVTSPRLLRLLAAAALILFGLYKFLRPRSHPRWVGMRVSPRELALWSFLMASAHGAGLMLVPVLLGMPASEHVHHAVAATGASDVGAGELLSQSAAAVLVHTLAMMAVMTVVAVVVYEKLGLALLRRAWINLDLLWATAIVIAGVVTLFT